MATNKEILFSARDNGIESTLSRIKRSAKELSSEMVREASKSSNSQKDIIKSYEDQIRLIERKNKLELEGQKIAAREKLDSKLSDPKASSSSKSAARAEFQDTINQITKGSKLDEMQVRLLREIADTMKLDMRQEQEQATREADEGGAGGGGRRGGAGAGGGGGTESQGATRGGLARQLDVAGYLMGVQQAMSANNAAQAAMGVGGAMMGMGGAVGKAGKLMQMVGMVGEVVNLSEDARADLHKQMFQVSALSGYSANRIDKANIGDQAYKLGFSRDEYLSSILPQVGMARGETHPGTPMYANTVMQLQRGTGLDMGTVMALEKIGARGMGGGYGMSGMDMVTRMLTAHEDTGAFKNKSGMMDFSRLQESMDQFVNMQQTLMMRSGNLTNMNNALFMSGKLEGFGGVYKNDQYKWSTIQALDKGITSTQTPESMAIKFNILRKAMPDATYSQMMEEMQKGIESEHLMPGIFDFVNQTGGDENQRSILFQQLMGNQMRWSDVNRMTSDQSIMYGMGGTGAYSMPSINMQEEIERRSRGAVSPDVEAQMYRTQYWQDVKGDPFGKGVDMLNQSLDGIKLAINELGNDMASWFE